MTVTPISTAARKPLLSICIPTYKRGPFVEAQVQSVISALLSRKDIDVELVVVNNKSPDDTSARLAKLSHPNMRVIEHKTHYDTVEENMMRSLEFLHGRYVWFLGDDDPIQLSNIDYVVELLREGAHDCFIFNSPVTHPDGSVADLTPMPMLGRMVSCPIDKIVELIGLVNTFAGISNIIQKRENLIAEDGLHWLETSKIYSHVAWFVESNRNTSVAFVNAPLVFYRRNDYSDGHWDRVAQRLNVQSLFFWSLGIVRLLSGLIARGVLTPIQAGGLFELAAEGFRYRLIDDITFKTFQQLQKAAASNKSSERFTDEEFAEIRGFCLRCDPTLYDMFEPLQEAQRSIGGRDTLGMSAIVSEKMSERFLDLYTKRQHVGQFVGRFAGSFRGFDVFRMPLSFVAVRSNSPDARDRTLRLVDPAGDASNTFVGATFDEVAEQILTATSLRNEIAAHAAATGWSSHDGSQHTVRNEAMPLLERSLAENSALRDRITAIYASTSWQVTAPMRALGSVFHRRA